MKTLFLMLIIALLSACTATSPTPFQATLAIGASGPTATVDSLAELRQQANIKTEDNGKTFTFNMASRFFVFLDDQNHPAAELKCSPEGIIGLISNGSLRGPGFYPVMYEGVQAGQCTLTNRDFSVQIEIK